MKICSLYDVSSTKSTCLCNINFTKVFDTLFQFATMPRAKIYGSPSDELQESLDPLGVEYFAQLNGIKRSSEEKTYTEKAREYARVRAIKNSINSTAFT